MLAYLLAQRVQISTMSRLLPLQTLRRPKIWGRALRSCTSSVPKIRPWGVVLDVDGVVVRGPKLIPGSAEALKMLREAAVPFMFMTNGGGITERAKARELSDKVGDTFVDASHVLLSHTPMCELAQRYHKRRVLVVGARDTVKVAENYGFDFVGGWAVTAAQVIAGSPDLCPQSPRPNLGGLPPINMNEDAIPIEAVLIFYEPVDWSAELQVIVDALKGGFPLGSGTCQAGKQAVPVYASNPDFLWQAAYAVPRFGQGAFLECLSALWQRVSGGGTLQITEYGKPHAVQYSAAEQMLSNIQTAMHGCENTPVGIERIYMIGDNPAADVRGANHMGGVWRSILVCTGVFRDGASGNDSQDPAWLVKADLRTAVEHLLQIPDNEHLEV